MRTRDPGMVKEWPEVGGASETVLGSMQQRSLIDGLLGASTSPRWLILALELAGCHTYFTFPCGTLKS